MSVLAPLADTTNTVYVIDDDRDVRTMISRMIADRDPDAPGLAPYPFGTAADFLESVPHLKPGCILLDLQMPDVDGFAVMRALRKLDIDWPVVVMTGAGDIPVAVEAMKLGAVEFLEKPIRQDALLATVASARKLLGERLRVGERGRDARGRIDQLSGRETEVLHALIAGRSNKEVAELLGIGLRTVEMHRGNMMERLGASSLAEVVALAIDAGIRPGENGR